MYLRWRRRQADFRASGTEVYQVLDLRGFESLVIKGACLSRIERRGNRSYRVVGSDVAGCRIRSDEARSLLNTMILMFLVRRKVNLEGGGGVGVRLR